MNSTYQIQVYLGVFTPDKFPRAFKPQIMFDIIGLCVFVEQESQIPFSWKNIFSWFSFDYLILCQHPFGGTGLRFGKRWALSGEAVRPKGRAVNFEWNLRFMIKFMVKNHHRSTELLLCRPRYWTTGSAPAWNCNRFSTSFGVLKNSLYWRVKGTRGVKIQTRFSCSNC